MSKFCKSCGTQLNPDTKFCGSCGAAVQAPQSGTQPPPPVNTSTLVPPIKKRKAPPKKLLFSAVAVVLVIALGAAILPRLGKEVANTEGTAGDLSALTYTERDYGAKAKELKVSPESPSASAHGVSIQFGEYALAGDETLTIRQLPEKTDKNNGVKVTAYDFELGDQTNFDDVITIAIPYDANYAEAGAESACIGAKYYNQTTGEWEGVYYEVDAKNRQVLIYTTHLSTYGVFQVKNENTRKAYITDVYAIAGLMNTGKSFEVIKELAEQGQPGNAAFEAGFEAVNSVTGNTGTALTAITLGGQYEGALADALGKGSQHLGLALAAVQTCYDFTYNFSDDQGKLSTLSNLVKNVANNAVGYFGSATLQVGFAAIAVFDVVLSEVQSDMMELKLENLGGVYQYYNDVEAPRSNQEWRAIFIKALKENADNPQMAQQQINQEIDSFCNRFWSLDYGKVKEIAGVSGLKYSFDERAWTKDREVLTAQYREYLLSRLQAPMTSARNYLLNQAMEQAQRELEKQLRALQAELNKTVKVQIIEQPEEAGDYQYEGYTVRFAPLSSSANAKNWTGKMPKGGEMNTSFTVIGHMQAGSPDRVELYKPGEDTPALAVPFKVSYPTTTIYLSSQGEEEQTQAEGSSLGEQSTAPAPEKEYAWVLVDTIHETRQANIDNLNKGGVYQESASASPGSYTHTWKYVGESDNYPDPDMLHGEGFSTQLTITVPPAQIKGGETVSLSFNLSFTEQNLSYFDGHGSCRADWGNLRFANADGKHAFEIYSSVKYSEKNVSSVSDTISAVIPAGYSDGDREELWTGDYTGTYYVYEWRQVGTSAPILNTEGIEGIVDLP
ncbi:zinc-ribbon domain-containing protein [Hominenteromicrobium sp.]|uniref:zinc-ribbon domain-containing protein n=1 Tax=Hominenteromicrobium sp. TaxID=3073581 RepID=UPI003AB247E0